MIKKILSSIFIASSTIAISGTIDTNSTIHCELKSSQPYGFAGDVSGKRVYTKKEYVYECKETKKVKESCKVWDEVDKKIDTTGIQRVAYYQSENFQGSIGEMMGVMQGYDKINGLWSGWHGMCQDGVDDGNWDWASDPYMWAGIALDVVGAGSTANTVKEGAKQTAKEAVKAAAKEARKKAVRYAVCAARAGLSVSQMLDDYYADDGVDCDKEDEMCGEGEKKTDSGSNIFTIPETKYNDLITNTPSAKDYIFILEGEGSGVLTVKMVMSNAPTATGSGSSDAEAAAKKQKEMALKVQAALMTIQLSTCISGASGGTAKGGDGSKDADYASAKNITTTAVAMYNPLLGAAVDVVWSAYDSITSHVDSCNNRDDAKNKGMRQMTTYDSKKLGMCHFINKVDKGSEDDATLQSRYYYCCYDDKSTRILVEQAKAQLGKDWTHCTDISLTELSSLSFSACDTDSLDSGVNGVDLPYNATQSQRNSAYQLTHHCIDQREYMANLLQTFGGPDMLIDTSDVQEMLDKMK